MGDRDDMWRELERRGAVYARIIFSVQDGQARVDAILLYDRYAPPWHHELGEVEPDSELGVALWVAGGGRDIEHHAEGVSLGSGQDHDRRTTLACGRPAPAIGGTSWRCAGLQGRTITP